MKHEEYNPVLFEEAYDALLERFSEYEEGCPKRRSAASDAQKKANQAGEAPKKQAPRKKPEVAKKPDAKPKRKKSCRTPLPTYSEVQDFAVGTGTGIACGASHISRAYVCRLDAGDRDKLTKELVAKGVSKSKLSKLSDQQISEVAKKAKSMPVAPSKNDERAKLIENIAGAAPNPKKAAQSLSKLNDEELKMVSELVNDVKTVPAIAKSSVLSPEDHSALLKRGTALEKLYKNSEKGASDLPTVSDNAVNAFRDSVPTKIRDKFKILDGDKKHFSQEEQAKSKFELTRRWMQQGGRDLYTGRKAHPSNLELEHIVPGAVLGRGPDGADRLSNMAWILHDVNKVKGNLTMKEFLDQKVRGVSASENAAKYASKGLANRGNKSLKENAGQAIKRLNGDTEQLLKDYGAKTKYLLSAVGLPYNVNFMPDPKNPVLREASRHGSATGKVKLKSGKTAEVDKWILRNWSDWTPKQQNRIRDLWNEHRDRWRDTKNDLGRSAKQLSLQEFIKQAEEVGG